MSVPETQRQEGKLVVLTKAKELAVYSGRILANQKKFDPMYDDFLGNDIKVVAKNIYRYIKFANNIRIQKETRHWREENYRVRRLKPVKIC